MLGKIITCTVAKNIISGFCTKYSLRSVSGGFSIASLLTEAGKGSAKYSNYTKHPLSVFLSGANMKSTRILFAVLLLSISLVSLSAQETRSALLGTVRDSAGAVVAGASVTITNTETNSNTTLTTNDSGYFEAPYLLPATYTITVTATGFKTYVQRGFALSVNSRANVD